MQELANTLYNLLVQLRFWEYFVTLFNVYFPYGSFFWLLGIALFSVAHIKMKNLAYAGAVASLYFIILPQTGLITNVYSATAMQYFGAILGIIIGFYIYRSFKGG